jgi:enolase
MKNFSSLKIESVHAREILDSRGFPTVEVDLVLSGGSLGSAKGTALVPSGASTGEGEALELRDGDKTRYQGKGVLKAVANVNSVIAPALKGKTFDTLEKLDETLIAMDGTPSKSKLGANAILGVSMAYVRAVSIATGTPTFRLLAGIYGSEGTTLPVPMMNIINGGKHADNGLAIQEFMIVPRGFSKFSEALRCGSEVFHTLKKILHSRGLATGVGDEGGFAPVLKSNEEALELLMQAILEAGYEAGQNVFLALDVAATEFYKDGTYHWENKNLSGAELQNIYQKWTEKFPLVSIEDGFSEDDWATWKKSTELLGSKLQLVGDDLFVTNPKRLQMGIDQGAANAILIKLNQIGTVKETIETIGMAYEHNMNAIISHRSGESEDSFIADLAVGVASGQIKTGSASRSERLAKYNQLLRIEESLGSRARFLGRDSF